MERGWGEGERERGAILCLPTYALINKFLLDECCGLSAGDSESAGPLRPKVLATIPRRLIECYFKFWPVRYENFRAAKHVLTNPIRIFAGVREFNPGGWCFRGRPTIWHIRETVTAPFPADRVFSVYLNPRLMVYECRAEYSSREDADLPIDWGNRYSGIVWQTTS